MNSEKTNCMKKMKQDDACLKKWHSHLEETRTLERKLCDIQERDVSGLQITAPDFRRAREEDKILFEHAQTPVVDKYRGKPNFFQLPPSLKRHPSLEAVLTKKQNYEIPEMEYVAVPKPILKEKHIGEISPRRIAMMNSYKMRRMHELKAGLKRVQPHKPCMSQLAVIGTKVSQAKSSEGSCSTTSETIVSEISPSEYRQEKQRPVAGIQVEDKEFRSDDNMQKCSQHYVSIDTDTSERGRVISSSIQITNIGELMLEYYWQLVEEEPVVDFVPWRPSAQQFVFKRNLTKLAPGEEEILDLHFPVESSGVFKETWRLCTRPNVFVGGEFLMRLWANVDCCMDLVEALEQRIDVQLDKQLISETIKRILVEVEYSEKPNETFNQVILESDLFEVTNADYSCITEDPLIYCYDPFLVRELKRLYQEVRTDNDPQEWDYNLHKLELMIQAKGPERTSFMIIYDDILRQMKRIRKPDTYPYIYEQAYDILCHMFDVMTRKIDEIRARFQIRKLDRCSKIPIKVKSELNLPTPALAHLRKNENQHERPPEAETIPVDDIEARYKLFRKLHPLPPGVKLPYDDTDKSKGGKSKNKNKKEKGSKPEVKIIAEPEKGKSKEEISINSKRKSRHNILLKNSQSDSYFSENNSEESVAISLNADALAPDAYELYKLNVNALVYAVLSDFMDRFDNMLTSMNRPIDRATLRKMIELKEKTGIDYKIKSLSTIPSTDVSLPLIPSSEALLRNVSLASICSSYSKSVSTHTTCTSMDEQQQQQQHDDDDDDDNEQERTSIDAQFTTAMSGVAQKKSDSIGTLVFKPPGDQDTVSNVCEHEIDVEELLKRQAFIAEHSENLEEYEKCADIESVTEASAEFFY